MGVLLKKRSGKFLPDWYGELVEDGKRTIVNLHVRWKGKPVGSLREKGDDLFEATRKKAREELERLQIYWREKGRAEHLTARLIEAKTGRKLEYVKLSELADKWRGVPRTRTPGKGWLSWCDTLFSRLAAECPVTYLHEVTPEMAAMHLQAIRAKCSHKTAGEAAQLLRSAFARFLPLGVQNPFAGGIQRKGEDDDGEMVHRRPFTVNELSDLFEGARDDAFLYPLVVTAACTGLRRGDVCRLKWSAVDLRNNIVAVKTSKTGATVEIPIFKPLREVLETALAEKKDKAVYVWPVAEALLRGNPDRLTWLFKRLLAKVLPDTKNPEEASAATVPNVERVKLADVLDEVRSAVENKVGSPQRERIVNSLRLYAAGVSVREIEKQTGQARSGVSMDLHRAEKVSGRLFMPKFGDGGMTAKISRVTRAGEPDGELLGRARRGSTLDWHALRVTWVTLALSAGVPIEVARLVTGHKTVEVVLKHYFKPGREHLRAVLGDKLPDVLTGGKMSEDVGRNAAVGNRRLAAGSGETVEGLAAKVAEGKATDEERKRLAELLRA
ncbi:MAG: Phage integrase family protein [Betaproteobacteria bacterium ADurb.Bin341]|nr:MAG: Phage integrase family protein [Betaproteobacteria bacterium ADurb.Bin341]